MSRVMMIGGGPLPRAGLPLISDSGLRTRQFLKPVADAGHTVNLFTIPADGGEMPEAKVAAMMPEHIDGLLYQRFTNDNEDFALRTLGEQVRQLRPDALVAIGLYQAYLATRLPATVPLWADLSGGSMAEAQATCFGQEDDAHLEDAWTVERAILRRLDKFSAVSRPHLHGVLGQMAAVGRLNHHNFHYQFGHRIPHAALRLSELFPPEGGTALPLLRGPIVPSDAFIILWSGPIQLWSDVATVVSAMNELMSRYPCVHFVVAGGRLEGAASQQFDLYEEHVEQSPHKDRFHNLGWIPPEQLVRVYHEADLGLNADSMNYETLFGGRSQLSLMAMEGLALVSTAGTEIVEWLEDGRAILTAPLGEPKDLAEAIEPWIEQREGLATYANHARWIMNEDFTPEKTVRPLLSWLESPALAPDNLFKVKRSEGKIQDFGTMALNPLEEVAMALDHHTARDVQQALAELDASRSKTKRRFIFGGR